MTERTILADCCEDWILEWGGFYGEGRSFDCPECATGWTKSAGVFRRADGRAFTRRERRGPDATFPYLAAVDGQQPDVDRCCAKILLAHGARLRDGAFTCPVCATEWTRGTERVHGFRIPVFSKQGLPAPLTIQTGRTRSYLVPLPDWSAPRD